MSLESKKTLWTTRGDAQGTADLEIEKKYPFFGLYVSLDTPNFMDPLCTDIILSLTENTSALVSFS